MEGILKPNIPEMTVSDLSAAVKRTVEQAFGLVRVRGELSRVKLAPSGHLYTTLKDETANLDAVCWKNTLARLSVKPEEGMDVICTGRMTTYPGKSSYQLVIENIELAGLGAILKMLEERRQRLAAEGLFDAARKKQLPFAPRIIGVVTSPTGAVIRDILHRIADRFPCHVLLWPVTVQGEQATREVVRAIEGFNRMTQDRPDVLIVARGGGSFEDLMAFNDEGVVRAAAASDIPLVSAIGHETDITLIDYAADRRAPTPTGAAEMAVPVLADLAAQVLDDEKRLRQAASRIIAERRNALNAAARPLAQAQRLIEAPAQRLDRAGLQLDRAFERSHARHDTALHKLAGRLKTPQDQIARAGLRLDHTAALLGQAMRQRVARGQDKLAHVAPRLRFPDQVMTRAAEGLERQSQLMHERIAKKLDRADEQTASAGRLLETLSHKNALARGFAVVRGVDGRLVAAAANIAASAKLRIEFKDGEIGATAD